MPKKANRVSFSTIFWIVLIIFLIIIFFTLLPIAKKNISVFPKQKATEQAESADQNTQPEPPMIEPPKKTPEKAPVAKEKTPEKAPEKPVEQPPQPETQQPAGRQAVQNPQPEQKQAETRERSVYFMQEGRGADLLMVKVNRRLAVSNSPLIDSINTLLAGPTAEESKRGLISCIPENSRLISARVVNNTAHLNFNEDFRYNTGGREDSAAQLKQIVWTATEFPNVHNVQIEIEGKIVDFLVEGITIRNPIGRN